MHLSDDFVFVLAVAALVFCFCSALLILKYRKSVVLCTFLLVPLMLFLLMQQHARFDGPTLIGFGLAAVAVYFALAQSFRSSRRPSLSGKVSSLADFLWEILPALVVPPILVAGLRKPLSVEIVIPIAMLSGCAVYLANFGRKRVRKTRQRRPSRTGYFRFGLRSIVLGGPIGVAMFISGLMGGSLVYLSGVSLFYGGLIQMPTTSRDAWSTRQDRTSRRIQNGFTAVIFGLALMLAGAVNVLATSS